MLIDSHCHLDRLNLADYEGELAGALDAARNRGVGRFLCIGIGRDNFIQVIDIARKFDDVYATVGLHPLEFNQANRMSVNQITDWLEKAAADPVVIGVGETGLDYYYSKEHIEDQQQSFKLHLEIAKKLAKPVIVHTRDAREDTLSLIRQYGCLESAGVLHCFTESWEMAQAGLDLNYYISFSGIVTFKNAAELHEVARKVPLDRILVETDSPYLAPVPYRGKSNEPKNVVEVAQCIAKLKGISYEAVCEKTSENFSRLFGVSV